MRLLLIVLPLICFAASPSSAQHRQSTITSENPASAGPFVFAELSRVIDILERDHDTNWDQVDLDALRDHLIDMELVFSQALSATEIEGTTVKFSVTSVDPKVFRAAKDMATAHGGFLPSSSGYVWKTQATEDSVVIEISAATSDLATKAAALGFFGMLTLDDHHSFHHEMMARGFSAH